nr:SDR family NAD(P)-dependent oxidoreductase [Rhodoferax sp.]
MKRLANKVALITGGGAGIGAATALLFCREGAAVTLVDADAQALEKTTRSIQAELPNAKLNHFTANVADEAQAVAAVQQSEGASRGRPPILLKLSAPGFRAKRPKNEGGIQHGKTI